MTLFRRSRTLVIGFLQERSSVRPVVKALREGRFFRSATVQVSTDRRPAKAGWIASTYLATVVILAFGALAAAIARIAFSELSPSEHWLSAIAAGLAGLAGGWAFARLVDMATAKRILAAYRRWVLPGETLVIVSARQATASLAVNLVSEAAGEHPTVFVLHPTEPPMLVSGGRTHPALGEDEILRRASKLAVDLKEVLPGRPTQGSLTPRLNDCERILTRVQDRLASAVRLERGIAISAEWLLDNAYIVQGHIEDFRRNLPPNFFRVLPFLKSGPHAGLPRIYAIACELVEDWDGALTRKGIESFLQTFQSETTLTSAELWALPMMLRLRIIEYLTTLSVGIEQRHLESERTAFWANRLLYAARRAAERMPEVLASVAMECDRPSPHIVEELLDHLYDEEAALTPVRSWLQSKFPAPLPDVVRQNEQLEAADQTSLANSISTLRLLSQFDWRDVFEAVSHVEAILWTDPAQTYNAMDFETRDGYRHRIERLSRRGGLSEERVAAEVVSLAGLAADDPMRHVGYYLVDEGLEVLEKHLGVNPAARERIRRWVTRNAAFVYLSGIGLTAATLVYVGVLLSNLSGSPIGLTLLLGLLFTLPAGDLAVQIVNYLLSRTLRPHALPKLSLADGIPDEFKTVVVVPMMLLTPDSIRDEVERLEIRALANPDKNLRFALLSDYSDAPQQHMPEDLELLEVAQHAIETLNARHGSDRYLLFFRGRKWSVSERCWMGWERKRGKLEQFNRFLMGDPGASEDVIVGAGSPDAVAGTRFVITLDSDTQLPRDTARRLVSTLAHPLNRPHVSPDGRRVLRGYTIIQPRVSTSLPSATASLFTRIFTDPTGMDPYTHAVSDVYQDLSGSGTYHGKGIYDLQAFHDVLSGRFPEEHLLSHDLIEGAYARVALASDIELLDLFPQTYAAYCSRQHRWIRGDWQAADWLLPSVPSNNGRERNPLPPLERWKILDNLRRSLSPAATLLMLLAGCAISPRPVVCAVLVAGLLFASFLIPLATRLTQRWMVDPVVWREPALNLVRALLFTAALPHQAWLALNATVRVFYRRWVSHRLLLEWAPANGPSASKLAQTPRLILQMAWAPLFAAAALGFVVWGNHRETAAILPFGVLWAASPFLLVLLAQPIDTTPSRFIPAADRISLRQVARQTWRYFDEFVGPNTHHLPPDNYQETLRVEVAERTSPTNIGLYLASALAAQDFGYITLDQLAQRVLETMGALEKLEHFRGHLLNWYDTRTLEPLGDRYVSTVDSGNLMGVLWTVEQGFAELLDAPLLGPRVFDGLADVLGHVTENSPPGFAADTSRLARLTATHPEDLNGIARRVRELAPVATALVGALVDSQKASDECIYWAKQLQGQVAAWSDVLDRYFGWIHTLEAVPEPGILSLGAGAHALRRQAMSQVPSLRMLATGNIPGVLGLIALGSTSSRVAPELEEWLRNLESRAADAHTAAQESIAAIDSAANLVYDMDRGMDMGFLFDPERRLFAIGYNVAEQRLDHSYYDLLASEARLSSFLAIARDEVPTEHWWALGRPFGFINLKRPLLSWNGTMFEYLMPLLLTKTYANSLLDQACRTAVESQIAYALKRGIPWGISESAYSALDSRQIYQYRAFGVPGLALKRGLDEDFVVSPYSSALALAINPRAAAKNLRRNGVFAKLGLRGSYGFCDSIDFTQLSGPHGERGIVVHNYMAHHQGMTLLAIDNAIHSDVMQNRFHADPRVQATASLLFERVPVAPPIAKSYAKESPSSRLAPIVAIPAPGRVESPDTPTPRTCLLSNGEYRLMVTNTGGGYSRWGEFDVTRWRADTTSDNWGKFCYLRDLDSGVVWSIAHQPVGLRTNSYHATFSADMAELRRRDFGIETITEIVVSPEDDAEIWRLTLINRSARSRKIQLTTYAELALAPHATDRTHPAFNKLFIQTAMLRDVDALLAWRRPRSADETPIWAAHVIASEMRSHEPTEFETDRARFIGRGRSTQDPIALGQPLSGTEGYVLDPIFSLRRTQEIAPGERAQVVLVLLAAPTRDQALALATKYRDPESASRAFHLAWTQAQLELRHLRITPADAQLYQAFASHILYPHSHVRAPAERLAKNRLGQRNLWAYGISGDVPIVVLTIAEAEHLDVVEEVLAAHTFWRIRGLVCDLVILNEEAASYEQPLHVQLQRIIYARTDYTGVDKPGGVFLRPARQIGPDDLNLLLSAAHVVLVAARGPLSQQISAPTERPAYVRPKSATVPDEPSQALPFLELQHFNGLGGFTSDGREYAVYLDKDVHTPRPWSNILANPGFGALVTDEGSGFAWLGNSQVNRLTAWSNDPIANPASDAIYIFDRELNAIWTPCALPIRENDPYRTRHGQGYTITEHNSHAIEQELTTFVPVDNAGGAPVRSQILKLTNRSSRRRTLAITFYAEWTLGADREATQHHVVTSWDLASKSLFARNPFSLQYGNMVAFAACSGEPNSFTCDRTEILGRNRTMSDPLDLRSRNLSGRCGGGLDPCAALQTLIVLEPNETREIAFVLGASMTEEGARETIHRFRNQGETAQALHTTRKFWDETLGVVTVQTPDEATNLLLNRWLLYQTLSCRVWGRSGLFQSGGAFGFRDQLQDVLGLLYSQPAIAREHILRCAGRQFVEGDVQHWWHPEVGAGVRTRISDDLLWLPYAVAQYVRVTGDYSVLDEEVPFIEGRLLDKGEHDAYFVPTTSSQSGTVWEHCRRAIVRGSATGAHGLPLIGGGDWNDGLNLVGVGGKGESIWLAWFLVQVLRDFAELASPRDKEAGDAFMAQSKRLVDAIESKAWDGEWYRRAYFDDGTPLGSKDSPEAQIDSLSQSWAAITGAGSRERAERAMASVMKHLVKNDERLVLLFEPPFDSAPLEPGYIKGYPPGVRENGGQYTHGGLWVAMAWARLGNGAEAVRLLQMMNPIHLAADPERYLVEAYAVAADVYSLPGRVGMGGWTWYTGSAAWMYRVWLEEILGFKLRGNRLTIEPVIPLEWPGYKLSFKFGTATYAIEVDNIRRLGPGKQELTLDGTALTDAQIPLVDDGDTHNVRVTL